jgi:hypothetical protein
MSPTEPPRHQRRIFLRTCFGSSGPHSSPLPLCVAWPMPAAQSHAAGGSSVPCADISLYTKFPRLTGGSRLVIGSLSVPPAYLRQVVRTAEKPWAYWRKAGLVVRAGTPAVTITVPPDWRARSDQVGQPRWPGEFAENRQMRRRSDGGPRLRRRLLPSCASCLCADHVPGRHSQGHGPLWRWPSLLRPDSRDPARSGLTTSERIISSRKKQERGLGASLLVGWFSL